MRALAYARATRPSTLEAVTVNVSPEETEALRRETAIGDAIGTSLSMDVRFIGWRTMVLPVLLLVLCGPTMSPYTRGVNLLRRSLEVAKGLTQARVVAVPLDPRIAATDPELQDEVVSAYAPGPVAWLGTHTTRLPGTHTVTASLIGYAIIRQTVDVALGAPREMVIELAEGNADFPYLCTDYPLVFGHRRDLEPRPQRARRDQRRRG